MDIKTHKPVWNVNVWTDFGGKPNSGQGGFGGGSDTFPAWAIAQCPLIYGDFLIIASQAPDAGVVAYDKLKGDVKWKTPSLGTVGYVSPAIVKIDREDHVVIITASDRRGAVMVMSLELTPSQGKFCGNMHNGIVTYQCQVQLMPVITKCLLWVDTNSTQL